MSSANAKPMWWFWWQAVKRFWWVFVAVALVAAISSFVVTRMMPQTYRAETWVEANPRARLDSDLFEELQNWQSGDFAKTIAARPNVTELTFGFFLRSDEMHQVMRDVVLKTMPDALMRFKTELEYYGETPSEGLDYWIKQNLVVDRNGKDKFYRLQWFFFTRTATEDQLEHFLERADILWQQKLELTLEHRLMSLQRYQEANQELPLPVQNALSQLQLDYKTLDTMLASDYLSVIRQLAPVEPTQGPIFPQVGKALIVGFLPFIVLAGLLLKLLGFREQRLCR